MTRRRVRRDGAPTALTVSGYHSRGTAARRRSLDEQAGRAFAERDRLQRIARHTGSREAQTAAEYWDEHAEELAARAYPENLASYLASVQRAHAAGARRRVRRGMLTVLAVVVVLIVAFVAGQLMLAEHLGPDRIYLVAATAAVAVVLVGLVTGLVAGHVAARRGRR